MNRTRWSLLVIATCIVVLVGVLMDRLSKTRRIEFLADSCLAAAEREDWKSVERFGLEWRQLASEDVRSAFWLGEALQCQQRYDESLDVLKLVPLEGQRGVDSAIRRMNILMHVKGQPLEAIKLADELSDFDPTIADPIRTRVYYFAFMLRRSELLQEIDNAIQRQVDLPEHYVYLMTLEDLSFRDGVEVVQKWIANTATVPGEFEDVLLAHRILRARENVVMKPSEEAKLEFERLRAELAASVAAGQTTACLLELDIKLELEAGNLARASELLKTVPETASGDPLFWIHRGRYSLDSGDIDDAESALTQALSLHRLSWQARSLLATVERQKSRLTEAAKAQRLGTEGAIIRGECLRLEHSRDIKRPLLSRIGDYAESCGAMDIAQGVRRRGM